MKIQYQCNLKDFKNLLKVMRDNFYFKKSLKAQTVSLKAILFILVFWPVAMSLVVKDRNFYTLVKSGFIIALILGLVMYVNYFVCKYNIFSIYSKRYYKFYRLTNLPVLVDFKKGYLTYQTEPVALTKVNYKDIKVYDEKDIIICEYGQMSFLGIPKRAFKTRKEIKEVLSLLKNKS